MSMSAPAARGAAPVPAATSGTGQAPVRVRGLTKRFGRVTALNGLDLTVAAGSVHGFLGPNGAGKSTALRTLLGLYRPDAVTIIKDGRVVEDGGLEHLRSLAATRIALRAAPERLEPLTAALTSLGIAFDRDEDRLTLQVGSQRVPAVLGLVAEQRITDVVCEPASLEDLFLRHYEDAR